MARLAGILAVICAAMLWGTTGTAQALLPEGKQPLIVAFLRLAIGATTLILVAFWARPSRLELRGLPLLPLFCAGLAMALYNILFFMAVLRAGVGVGTAIAIGSGPIWVTLYEVLVRRQVPGPLRAFGQAVSIAGACLLVLSGPLDAGPSLGYLLAAIAGAAYASYSLITGRISGRAPPATIAAATFSSAALLTSPLLLLAPIAWALDPRAVAPLLFLGVCATGLSYVLFTWGLRRVAVSTAVTLALAEPLTAWLLATLVVGEPLTAQKLAGAACLIAGLAIVSLAPARRGGRALRTRPD